MHYDTHKLHPIHRMRIFIHIDKQHKVLNIKCETSVLMTVPFNLNNICFETELLENIQ